MVDVVFAKEPSPSSVSYCPDGAAAGVAANHAPHRFHRGSAVAPAFERARRNNVELLVTGCRHLCRRGARKFWRSGLERCDLEQVAAIGLIKAAQRYDAALGTPFEAYAWLFVVGELMHYVRDFERTIRLPRRVIGLERRYTRAHEKLLAALGREPSDEELAAELGVVPAALDELRAARAAAAPQGLEDVGADALPDPQALTSEDRILVHDAFGALSITERRVIAGVYLLGLTQLELSHRLGISAKRVSRIQHGALGRMASACAS